MTVSFARISSGVDLNAKILPRIFFWEKARYRYWLSHTVHLTREPRVWWLRPNKMTQVPFWMWGAIPERLLPFSAQVNAGAFGN